MYNTFMSKEDVNKLKPGDEVTVRQLKDLKHDYGDPIKLPPCGWNDNMNKLCGKILTVSEIVEEGANAIIHAVNQSWALSIEMIEPYSPAISSEEMSAMWENMILGGKG